MKKKVIFILISFLLVIFISCGSDKREPEIKMEENYNLSPFEIENGIGPVKEKIELGPIDKNLVQKGEELWNRNCTICHKFDEEYLGPPQRNVLSRRTPEFVMNILLNPTEMQERHPAFARPTPKYTVKMPYQNLSYDEARAIVEFLRDANK